MRHPALLAVLLLAAVSVSADDAVPAGLEALPDVPPPPPPVASDETLEPEVTIIQKETETIEEYRVSGKLFMVKVTPIVGPPYYLVDNDGDGNMESRMSEIYSDFVIPKWVLFSW